MVYLFLCIIPLCVATSSFLVLHCMWGVFGCDCRLFFCFSPFAKAVSAPSQLYFLCHFNATSVLVIFCRHFLWFFLLNCFLYHLGWVGNGLLLLLHAFCFVLFLALIYKSSADLFFFLYYSDCSFSVLWTVESAGWCSVVRGYKGLPFQPMVSLWNLSFELALTFVVCRWYSSLVVALLSPVCIRVWNIVFQPACFFTCPSGSDSA